MGRPQLALGTYGTIRVYKTDAGYRACTKARDYDGRTRAIERWTKTKAAAERSLTLALGGFVTLKARAPRSGAPPHGDKPYS